MDQKKVKVWFGENKKIRKLNVADKAYGRRETVIVWEISAIRKRLLPIQE